MFIVDAHLDLSMNALEWNRDLTQSITTIRKREQNLKDKPDRRNGTVSLPSLREGNIGLVVATLIARYVEPTNPLPGWNSPHQAWAQTQGQLAWYKTMEMAGEMKMIKNQSDLKSHVDEWDASQIKKPIGYVLSLEGADSIVTPDYVYKNYHNGLRAIGLGHYGPGRYAHGTDASAPLNEDGKSLLKVMDELNMILDTTHLCDAAFWNSLSIFNGPIWASHNNCRSLVNHNRQFSDEMIKAIIDRNGVIGAAFDAWMLVPNWQRGISTPIGAQCTIEKVIDHMVHISGIAGNVNHIGIGSDLDGAFGKEQSPLEIDTIADLQLLIPLLDKRGFTTNEINQIMHQNWINFLAKHLPQG